MSQKDTTPDPTGTRPSRFQIAGTPINPPYQGPSNERAHGSTPWTSGMATNQTNGAKARAAQREGRPYRAASPRVFRGALTDTVFTSSAERVSSAAAGHRRAMKSQKRIMPRRLLRGLVRRSARRLKHQPPVPGGMPMYHGVSGRVG